MCVAIGDLGQYVCLCDSDNNSEFSDESKSSIVKRSTLSICVLSFVLFLSFALIATFFIEEYKK